MPKLPSGYSRYPKEAKPKSFAPHSQRTIEAAAQAVRGAQRTIEAMARAVRGGQREIDGAPPSVKSPKPGKSDAKKVHYSGGKGGYQDGNTDERNTRSFGVSDPDPWGAYYFELQLDGIEDKIYFMECSGLKNAAAVFEIQEGGLNGGVYKRPGQSKWENLILKFASSPSTALLEWRDAWIQDVYAKEGGYFNKQMKHGSVAMKSNDGKTVRTFHFRNAWPVSWEGPALNASSSALAIESLELAHDGLTLEKVGGGAPGSSTQTPEKKTEPPAAKTTPAPAKPAPAPAPAKPAPAPAAKAPAPAPAKGKVAAEVERIEKAVKANPAPPPAPAKPRAAN